MKEKLVGFATSRRFRKIGLGGLVGAGILIGAILIAFAVTQISVSNTGRVNSGASIALATTTCGSGATNAPGDTVCVFTTAPTCSSNSGAYTATSGAIDDWNVTQGGSVQDLYVCIENTGTSAISVSASWSGTGADTGVSCQSPTSGTLAAQTFMSVNLQCSASATAIPGNSLNFGSFTIT